MTTARVFLTRCLIWLLTLASPAGAAHLVVDLQKGIAQSVFAGLQEGAPERLPGQSDEDFAAVYNAWKNDVAGQAKLLGAVVGYTTSSGQAANVGAAASIGRSGFENNAIPAIVWIIIAAGGYTTVEGGGDPIEGLRVIGRGEDLIGSMVLSGAEEAFLFSNEHFPAATETFVEAMMRAGEGAAVMVNFADKATGQVVSTAWNDLPQDTRDAIIGGGVVVSFVVPAGAATRIARATPDVATNGGNRPDFYVSPNVEAVEGTLYRYSDSAYADDILQNGGSPAIDGRGHYLGTEALDSASSVRDRYQIAPEWSNPTVRGELDSIQLYDPNTSTWRLQTPTSNGNTTTIPEPYTSAYPEYGTGGARQYTTDPNTPIRYDNVDIIGD